MLRDKKDVPKAQVLVEKAKALQKEDPDVSLPAEKRQIGGLGIFLVRKTMDHMAYRREGGKNILTIRKKI